MRPDKAYSSFSYTYRLTYQLVLFSSYHNQTENKEKCHLVSVLLPFYENIVSAKVPYLFENLFPYIF